jgi:hypothetical protein
LLAGINWGYDADMSVRIFYIDESYDDKKFCLSAIAVKHTDWKECFNLVREHRKQLKQDYGIFLRKEIHATDFIAGRGRIGERQIGKWERSRLFLGLLQLVARLPKVLCFNVCLDVPNYPDPELTAWDRMINRIERAMVGFETDELPLRRRLVTEASGGMPQDSANKLRERLNSYRARAIIAADEGREIDVRRAIRKNERFQPDSVQAGHVVNRTGHEKHSHGEDNRRPYFQTFRPILLHPVSGLRCVFFTEARNTTKRKC